MSSGSIRRSLRWRRITRSGIACLFGFGVLFLLSTAVSMYKDAFHCCFNFNPIPVVFLSLFPTLPVWFWWGIFAINPLSAPLIVPPPFCCLKVIIILQLLVLPAVSPPVWFTHSCPRILPTIRDVWGAVMLCELGGHQLFSLQSYYSSLHPSILWALQHHAIALLLRSTGEHSL